LPDKSAGKFKSNLIDVTGLDPAGTTTFCQELFAIALLPSPVLFFTIDSSI
jgi:hypothetical protein